MPNGGPDCCGNCLHNRAVQKMSRPQPEQYEQFEELSYCKLREVNITNPFWTYCQSYTSGKWPEHLRKDRPVGWIYASGLYEGYTRIPWNGEIEPHISVPAKCLICGRETQDGIVIKHDEAEIGFCTNRHYVEWWKTIHKDDSLTPENYESPEERFKNK